MDTFASHIAGSDVAGPAVGGEGKWPLLEDHILRGFPPIVPALQAIQFGGSETHDALSKIQEVTFIV